MSALCLAIRARKTWAANGRVSGEGLQESEVLPVIELLLALGADVDGSCVEVHTHGSWAAETCAKKPLFLAIETGSVEIVRLLLDAGASPQSGKVEKRDKSDCSAALKGLKSAALKKELSDMLRRQSPTVADRFRGAQ